MVLKCLLMATTVLFGRDVVRTNSPSASWHSSTTWDGGILPDNDDRVLIPGRAGQTSLIKVNDSRQAASATTMVGKLTGSKGTLKVFTRLRVAGPNIDGETQAGRFFVGGKNNKNATVTQFPGSDVFVADTIRLADLPGSTAKYSITGADLRAVQAIQMGSNANSKAVFQVIGGDSNIRTKTLRMGSGDSRLLFTVDSTGVSEIKVTQTAELQGTLKLKITDSAPSADKFKLLNLSNNASQSGGFRRVMIDAPPGRHYEVSYTGGNDNDVLIVSRPTALVRFEEWKSEVLADPPSIGAGRPRSDADGDKLSNIGEYKLGCNPLVDEGDIFVSGIASNGKPFIEFVERKDRTDVRTVVQTSFDGRVWTSQGVTTTTVVNFGNTRTVKAVADTLDTNVKFRLFFELVPDADTQPNVLFITVDDLNDYIEVLGGHPESVTPNLNALAARGTLFTNAHSAAPICHASRTALLTGVSPATSGVYANSTRFRDSPVLANAKTIPEQFASNGYESVGAGKIFHRAHPEAWSAYFPSLTDHRPDDPVSPIVLSGVSGLAPQFDWGPLDIPDGEMGDHQVGTWIVNRIKNGSGQVPEFIACGFFRPHLPLYVPEKYFNPWDASNITLPLTLANDLDDVPSSAFTDSINNDDHGAIVAAGKWKEAVRAYLAAVRFSDAQLGRVIAALDDSALARNTIVVLCSDHGWHLGEKSAWRKNSLWEESTRVPLIIVAPGLTEPGTRCDELVSLLDVYPTLIDLADISNPGALEGTSLVPQLVDPTTPRTDPVLTTRSQFSHSVRTDRYRFSRHSNGEEELYDHSVDANEWFNLAGDPDYAAVIEQLEASIPANPTPPPVSQ